jgi:hypothetical protein
VKQAKSCELVGRQQVFARWQNPDCCPKEPTESSRSPCLDAEAVRTATPKSVADTTSVFGEMQTVFYKYFTIYLQINPLSGGSATIAA